LSKIITLNGRQYLVSSTVRDILADLAFHDHPRLIWIDSICVDQNNDEEKAVQIPLMRPIYQQASVVHICLGHAGGADIAIGLAHGSLHHQRYAAVSVSEK